MTLEKQVAVIETVGTIYWILRDFYVAGCIKGHLYYLPRKGKGQTSHELEPSALVRIYHSEGPYSEVFAYEPA